MRACARSIRHLGVPWLRQLRADAPEWLVERTFETSWAMCGNRNRVFEGPSASETRLAFYTPIMSADGEDMDAVGATEDEGQEEGFVQADEGQDEAAAATGDDGGGGEEADAVMGDDEQAGGAEASSATVEPPPAVGEDASGGETTGASAEGEAGAGAGGGPASAPSPHASMRVRMEQGGEASVSPAADAQDAAGSASQRQSNGSTASAGGAAAGPQRPSVLLAETGMAVQSSLSVNQRAQQQQQHPGPRYQHPTEVQPKPFLEVCVCRLCVSGSPHAVRRAPYGVCRMCRMGLIRGSIGGGIPLTGCRMAYALCPYVVCIV
jgi:hypothetical protein